MCKNWNTTTKMVWSKCVLFWLLSLTTELIFFLVFSSTEHSKSTLCFFILWIPQTFFVISIPLFHAMVRNWCIISILWIFLFWYKPKWICIMNFKFLNLIWDKSFAPFCSILREFESPLSFFTFQITKPTCFHLVPTGL